MKSDEDIKKVFVNIKIPEVPLQTLQSQEQPQINQSSAQLQEGQRRIVPPERIKAAREAWEKANKGRSVVSVGEKRTQGMLIEMGISPIGGGATDINTDDYRDHTFRNIADEVNQEVQRVREASEKAKIELSSTVETEINLPFITQKGGQPLHLTVKLTRSELEKLVDDLIQKTIDPVEKCLKDAKVSKSDITDVVMVGGMTRMPKVLEVVKNYFGKLLPVLYFMYNIIRKDQIKRIVR